MSEQSAAIRAGIFVDTEALHYIHAYLNAAQKYDFAPYGLQSAWPEINSQLRVAGALMNQRDNLRKGFTALSFLQEAAQEENPIFVSQLSLAEIVHGLVEGTAHIRMAEAGLPYRMRQRASDLSRLVRAWMEASDYEQARRDTEALLPELEHLLQTGIRIAGQERISRETLSLIQVILGHVYFDVIDSWLYAEALIEQAQQILTFDNYFGETVNRIRDPSGIQDDEERGMWIEARSSLQAAVANILMLASEDARFITMPRGVRP